MPDHSTYPKNRHGRFRQCGLYRLLFEGVVARCAAGGLVVGRELPVDGSTIQADASREKKRPGATATDSFRTREDLLRSVAEHLAALDAALPSEPNKPAPVEPTYVSTTDPQAAFTRKGGFAHYAYRARPRHRARPVDVDDRQTGAVAPDTLDWQFTATRPNEKSISTDQLAQILNLHNSYLAPAKLLETCRAGDSAHERSS